MADDLERAFLASQDHAATVLEVERLAELRKRHLERRQGKKVGPPIRLGACPGQAPARGRIHLMIGDAHAHPEHPNWRFEWLGRLIVDIQPDVIWDAGDWFDLPSLFGFDKGARGTRQFEGRRYWLDLEAGIDAMERVQFQLDEYNRGKRRRYKPRLIRTLGNHEERIQRVIEWEPRFEEVIGYRDLMSQHFGWEEHPPGETVEVDGIHYVHYPFGTAGWGGPIYLGANAIRSPRSIVAARSSAFGHSHRRDYHETAGPAGRIQSISVGCFFDYSQRYLPESEQRRWWSGLVLARNVTDGTFDHEWISLEEVRRRYG